MDFQDSNSSLNAKGPPNQEVIAFEQDTEKNPLNDQFLALNEKISSYNRKKEPEKSGKKLSSKKNNSQITKLLHSSKKISLQPILKAKKQSENKSIENNTQKIDTNVSEEISQKNNYIQTEIQENTHQIPEEPSTTEKEINSIDNSDNTNSKSKNISIIKIPVREICIPTASNENLSIDFRQINTKFSPPRPVLQNPKINLNPEEKRLLKKTKKPKFIDSIIIDKSDETTEDIYLNYLEIYHNMIDFDYLDIVQSEIPDDLLEILTDLDFDYKMISFTPEYIEKVIAHKHDSAVPVPEDPDSELEKEIFRKQKEIDLKKPQKPSEDIGLDSSDYEYQDKMKNVVLDIEDNRGNPKYISDALQSDSYYSYPSYSDSYSSKSYQNYESQNNFVDETYNTDNNNNNYTVNESIESTPLIETRPEPGIPKFTQEEEEKKEEPEKVPQANLIQEAIEEDNKVRRRRQRIQPEFPTKNIEEEKEKEKPQKPKIELKPEDFRKALYGDTSIDNAKATALKKRSESLASLEESNKNNKNLPSEPKIIIERVPIEGTNKVKLIKKIVKKVLVQKKVEPKKEIINILENKIENNSEEINKNLENTLENNLENNEEIEYETIEVRRKINKKKKKKTKKTPIVTKEENKENNVVEEKKEKEVKKKEFTEEENKENEEVKNKEFDEENDEKIDKLVEEIQLFDQKQLEEARRQEEERIKQEQKRKEEEEKMRQQEAQQKEEKLLQVLQFLKETNQLPPKENEVVERKQEIVPKEKVKDKEKEKEEKFSREKRDRSPIYRRKENKKRIELVSPLRFFDDSEDLDTKKNQQIQQKVPEKKQETPKEEKAPEKHPYGKRIDPSQFFVEEEKPKPSIEEEIKQKIDENVTEVNSDEKPIITEQTNETNMEQTKEEKPQIEKLSDSQNETQQIQENIVQNQENETQTEKTEQKQISNLYEAEKQVEQQQNEITEQPQTQKSKEEKLLLDETKEQIVNQIEIPEQKIENIHEKVSVTITEIPQTDRDFSTNAENQIPVEQIASEITVIENEQEKVEEKIEEEEEKIEPRIRFSKINCIVDEGWKFYDFQTNNPSRILGISDKPISLPVSPDFNFEDEEKLQKPLLFLDAMTDWREMSDEVIVTENEERLQTKNGIIKFEANLKSNEVMTFKKDLAYDRLKRSPSFDFAELEKFSRFFKQEMNKQKKSLKQKDIKFDTNFEVLNIKNRITKIIHENKQEKHDTKVIKPIITEEHKSDNETWDNYKEDLFVEKEPEEEKQPEKIDEKEIENEEKENKNIDIQKVEENEKIKEKEVEKEEQTVPEDNVETEEMNKNDEEERIAKEKEERKRRKEEMKKAKEQARIEIEERKKSKQKLLRQVKKSLSLRVGQTLSYPLPPIVPEIEDEEENELEFIERGCISYPVDDYIDKQLFELADDDLKKELEDVAYNLMFDVNLKEAKIYDDINFGFCEKHNLLPPKRRAYDIVMSEKEKRDKLVIERKQNEEEMKKQKEREEEENIRREIEEKRKQEQIKKLQEDQERREMEERKRREIEDRKRMELERQKQEEEELKRKQREEEERRRKIEKERKKRQKEEEARRQKLLEEQRRREFEERRIRQLEEQKQREEEKLKERKEMEEKRKVELEMEKQKQLRELKENYELRKKELEMQKQRKEHEEQRRKEEEERKKREMEETKKKLLEKKKKNENSKKKKKIKVLDEEIRIQNLLKINSINSNKLHYVVEEDNEPEEYRLQYDDVLFCRSWPENAVIYSDLRDNFPDVFAMTYPDDQYIVNSIETFENLAENPKIVEIGIDMNYEYSLTPLTQSMQPRVQTALQAISTEIETAKDLLEHDKLIVNDIIRQKASEKL